MPWDKVEGQLLHRVGAGLARVVTGDGDRVPVGDVLGAVLHDVSSNLQRRPRRQGEGLLPIELLQGIVLHRPPESIPRRPAGLGDRQEHTEHRDGRMVDGEGDADLVQGNRVKQLVHVSYGVDSDTQPSHLPIGQIVIGVVSGQSWVVEVGAQARLSMVQQESEPLVGGTGRTEPGDLAPRPWPAAVHGGVRPHV